jgi:hypothetical protein
MISTMTPSAPDDVEMVAHKGYWEARYLGAYSIARYKKQMEYSVGFCEQKGGSLLLVDIRTLAGYAPSVQERYELGRYGAEISKKLARVAALGTADQITDSFASLVARNRGLKVRSFSDRKAAVAWLLKG